MLLEQQRHQSMQGVALTRSPTCGVNKQQPNGTKGPYINPNVFSFQNHNVFIYFEIHALRFQFNRFFTC